MLMAITAEAMSFTPAESSEWNRPRLLERRSSGATSVVARGVASSLARVFNEGQAPMTTRKVKHDPAELASLNLFSQLDDPSVGGSVAAEQRIRRDPPMEEITPRARRRPRRRS
jgi:hypothetical protein